VIFDQDVVDPAHRLLVAVPVLILLLPGDEILLEKILIIRVTASP